MFMPLGVVILSTFAYSMEPWEQQLQQQTMIKAGDDYGKFAARGYTLVDVAKTGLIDASGSEVVQLTLPVGSAYILMGVCDNDCLDLDLSLMKDGIELSTDTKEDDWPLVEVTSTGTADYALKVTMYKCGTPNCGYQLSVWKK